MASDKISQVHSDTDSTDNEAADETSQQDNLPIIEFNRKRGVAGKVIGTNKISTVSTPTLKSGKSDDERSTPIQKCGGNNVSTHQHGESNMARKEAKFVRFSEQPNAGSTKAGAVSNKRKSQSLLQPIIPGAMNIRPGQSLLRHNYLLPLESNEGLHAKGKQYKCEQLTVRPNSDITQFPGDEPTTTLPLNLVRPTMNAKSRRTCKNVTESTLDMSASLQNIQPFAQPMSTAVNVMNWPCAAVNPPYEAHIPVVTPNNFSPSGTTTMQTFREADTSMAHKLSTCHMNMEQLAPYETATDMKCLGISDVTREAGEKTCHQLNSAVMSAQWPQQYTSTYSEQGQEKATTVSGTTLCYDIRQNKHTGTASEIQPASHLETLNECQFHTIAENVQDILPSMSSYLDVFSDRSDADKNQQTMFHSESKTMCDAEGRNIPERDRPLFNICEKDLQDILWPPHTVQQMYDSLHVSGKPSTLFQRKPSTGELHKKSPDSVNLVCNINM